MPPSQDIAPKTYIASAEMALYPGRPGNLVRPLVDDVPAFHRIGQALEFAEHSIWLTVAFVADDFRFPNGRTLFDALDRLCRIAPSMPGASLSRYPWSEIPGSGHVQYRVA